VNGLDLAPTKPEKLAGPHHACREILSAFGIDHPGPDPLRWKSENRQLVTARTGQTTERERKIETRSGSDIARGHPCDIHSTRPYSSVSPRFRHRKVYARAIHQQTDPPPQQGDKCSELVRVCIVRPIVTNGLGALWMRWMMQLSASHQVPRQRTSSTWIPRKASVRSTSKP